MSRVNLALFEADPAHFLERFHTQDECWVHHFEPETKRQSPRWKHPSSSPPKKAKVVSSDREGDGLRLLGCKGHCVNLLHSVRPNYHWGNTMRTCWGSCERQLIQNGLENWRRESCFTRAMLLHTSLWLQCVTVFFNWLITFHILLIWHHLNIFCSPTWQNPHLIGKQYWTNHYLQLRTYSRIRMRVSMPRESKRCNTDGRSVWIAGETIY